MMTEEKNYNYFFNILVIIVRYIQDFPGGAVVKNLPANAGEARDAGPIPTWKDPMEQKMATPSSILTWEIPWTEEPGGLQFKGSQKDQTRLSG